MAKGLSWLITRYKGQIRKFQVATDRLTRAAKVSSKVTAIPVIQIQKKIDFYYSWNLSSMIGKLTDDKHWLKKAVDNVVRYRIKYMGNPKLQLVATDFHVIQNMLVKQ